MAMPKKSLEKAQDAARHCLTDRPYRMVVFKRCDGSNTPLYLVAGSNAGEAGAEKALKRAYQLHGGTCFYCKETVRPEEFTLDHAEPQAAGGKANIQNLLIACQPCNLKKGPQPIELFNPEAGREWLSAVLAQVQERLSRL